MKVRIERSDIVKLLKELEKRSDEEIEEFFEKRIKEEKGGTWKLDKCELALKLVNTVDESNRVQMFVRYEGMLARVYRLSDFIRDLFDGRNKCRYGYMTYTTNFTGAKWIDVFVRPKMEGEVEHVYMIRLGWGADGEPVDEEDVHEFADFLRGSSGLQKFLQ